MKERSIAWPMSQQAIVVRRANEPGGAAHNANLVCGLDERLHHDPDLKRFLSA
jgi:hypothetical protein